MEPLPSYTPATVTEISILQRELDQIGDLGWASEAEELLPGIASIGAPIEDRRGVMAGAISISGPIERLWEDQRPRVELVGFVMETARTVSRELGAIPW